MPMGNLEIQLMSLDYAQTVTETMQTPARKPSHPELH